MINAPTTCLTSNRLQKYDGRLKTSMQIKKATVLWSPMLMQFFGFTLISVRNSECEIDPRFKKCEKGWYFESRLFCVNSNAGFIHASE